MSEFEGRVALIAGGARGIGGGVASALAEAGASVVITDILDTEGRALAEKLSASGRAEFHHLDVRSESEWASVTAEVERAHGRLDVVVNAAGILVPGGIEDTSYETACPPRSPTARAGRPCCR